MENKNNAFKDFIKNNINELGVTKFIEQLHNENYSKQLINIAIDEVNDFVKTSKVNTVEDLAKILNNNQYNDELKNDFNIDVEQLCKDNGWVIIYPESDDLLYVCGVINEEFNIYDNGTIKFVNKDVFYSVGHETYQKTTEDCFIQFNKSRSCNALEDIFIEATLCHEYYPNQSWHLEYNMPEDLSKVTEFIVMDGDEIFSNAIIIDLSNVLNK